MAINWQRPTFPRSLSIIGAEELNDRVRDGNGCDLFARITRGIDLYLERLIPLMKNYVA